MAPSSLPPDALLVVRTWQDGTTVLARITIASAPFDTPRVMVRTGLDEVRGVVLEWLALLEASAPEP